ncbi:dipeptidase [Candidatus Palauibacter sp.]|uniref:dipeptidase n=1 Tax=Candidatus Palauibacter sp. TaxID=3101350 RepID=UPI003B02618B
MRQPARPHQALRPALFLSLAPFLAGGCGEPADEAGQVAGEEASVDEAELLQRAREIHESVLTIDTHDDIPYNFATPEVDPLNADRQVNLEKMRAGGLDVGFFIVYVGQTARTPENYEAAKQGAITKFEAIHRMADEMYPDLIGLAHTADDAERIHAEGRLVAAIGIENGYVIGTDLSLLERYHELGARYITLAHNGNNDIADSAQPNFAFGDTPEENGGISSDFDGGGGIEGWSDASETLNVTVELVRRGYSEEEIRQLWGGNTLRIWRAAEEVAAEMQRAGE